MNYKLGKYTFTFSNDMKFRTYENEFFRGIVFNLDDIDYDIVENYVMGYRISWCGLNSKIGLSKDIPFHKGTFGFLPPGVIVEEHESKES